MAMLFMADGWDADPWRAAFAAEAPHVDLRIWPDQGNAEDVDYALVWSPPQGALARFGSLKAIVSLAAGVDHLLADPTLPDVPILRLVDPQISMRMSEYVVHNVLLHHRQFLALAQAQREKRWEVLRQPAASEVRVGVMGLGALGMDAARKLTLLGFAVAGWSRSAKAIEGLETYAGREALDPFLRRTDILVCLLPLTPDTAGILNADTFARLARRPGLAGPVLINAGRGGLHVERDILAALDDGTLHGASLDVFETEPLPGDSRLWTHPRVVISPHMASDPGQRDLVRNILAQIRRIEEGLPLSCLVDRSVGY
ncbi:2-hydroxyacid dehydrogenase [Ensifer soli]|uniref:2-hydroxyacid dehydrogenase n=1 Tax=Ciceribacter sp. sgz301302 TaxID=3342379 RepID=UPI0035BB726C